MGKRRGPATSAGEDDLQLSLLAGEHALFARGDLGTGRKWFDAAYREAERRDDGVATASAALGLSGLWVHEHRTAADEAMVRVRQRHALSLIDPRSPLALRLRARLAAEEAFRTGDHAEILAMVPEARRAGDVVALVETLRLAHNCVTGPEHGALRSELAGELIGEATRTNRRADLLMGLLWRTVDLFLEADPHSERALGELRSLLAREDHLAVGFVVSGIEVMLSIRGGRLAEAEALASACAERGAAADDPTTRARYVGHIGTIRWYQGRLGELVPTLSELVNSPMLGARDNSYFAVLAVAAATAGDRRLAASMLARLCGRDLAEVPRSGSWLVTMYGVVEAAHLLEEAEVSAQAYRLLAPFARLPVLATLGVTCLGSVHHSLGVASLTTGDATRAVDHLRAAVRDNLALGHWPAVALSRARLGQALALRDGTHGGEARRELALAAEEAAALGTALPVGMPREWARRAGNGDAGEGASPVTCRRRGRQWQLEMDGRTVLVPHSVGMGHLAMLLADPGREIPAADLIAGPVPARAATRVGGAPPLDERSVHDYKRRLSQLQDDIDECESMNEIERVAALRAERDRLIDEVAGATGLAGRLRPFTGSPERARIAVGKAIRRALDAITAADPGIGAELRATVETGARCCYRAR
ncbi:hypothetical protein GCM10022226_40630 [Sphaerisporangium flaviroseum]|uniref:MalT-like TPR region domain-containing protein n=1 Tax=Sphaerisporangium flaviroseum TaxID=509199 RepID=A0ABP7IDH3_9ACTN